MRELTGNEMQNVVGGVAAAKTGGGFFHDLWDDIENWWNGGGESGGYACSPSAYASSMATGMGKGVIKGGVKAGAIELIGGGPEDPVADGGAAYMLASGAIKGGATGATEQSLKCIRAKTKI